MNNVVYISDAFLDDIVGGGELNDHELLQMLHDRGHAVVKKRSHRVTLDFINENSDSFFIISNFVGLNPAFKERLQDLKYIIYEHDHKYVKTRNPALYKNFQVPQRDIVNFHFYKNAAAILCQSAFHRSIIENNLKIDNVVSVGGNIWPLATLEKIRKYSQNKKNNACAVLESAIAHKNTAGAVQYCQSKGLKHGFVASPDYEKFLESISHFGKFVFLPKTPETLSRIVVEARMLGCKVVTNGLVGATSERWFELKGEALIDRMIEKRAEILSTITEIIDSPSTKTNDKPLVSIITTFYEAEEYLEGFLEDITSQTIFPQCELVIVDTGSPGSEQQIIKPYLQKFDNIKYHRHNSRLSPTRGFNMALKQSVGKYVTWAMLDDRKKSDNLEILLKELEQNPAVDLVYGDCLVTAEKNQKFGETDSTTILENSSFEFSLPNMVKCLPGPMPMWTRRMTEAVGFLDEDDHDFADDWELWLRSVAWGFKFKKVDQVIGLYRSGGRSQAETNPAQLKEEATLFYKYSNLFGQNYAKYEPYFRQFMSHKQ